MVAENSGALRRCRWSFFEAVGGVLRPGSLLVATEATHRMWPDLVLAAFRGAARACVAAAEAEAAVAAAEAEAAVAAASGESAVGPGAAHRSAPAAAEPTPESVDEPAPEPTPGAGPGACASPARLPAFFDVAFPQVACKRGYALVLHRRPPAPGDAARATAALAAAVARDPANGHDLELCDLEGAVGPGEWVLLGRFKHDSDRHDRKAPVV